ncbi:unnamed protein product [Adineta steineri]|uniref:ABC transporter domain-containing protein n=1 Tax=Adineta steineri TaxID=433720 RepID=A0A819JFF1_9BILA|nr:unnamed protein product [Adineta steineri]CAF3929278.1 unnamed protein product [Adineta steineri]
MWLYHLWLLGQKSLRYAWRRRACKCCPKIIFEFFIPAIFLLLLFLVRWLHTPSPTNNKSPSSPLDQNKPTQITIANSSIVSQLNSKHIFNYTFNHQCPSSNIKIEIVDNNVLQRLKSQCPKSNFISSSKAQRYNGYFLLNTTSERHNIYYQCSSENKNWCQNISTLKDQDNSIQIQHPSAFICSDKNIDEVNDFLKNYLALESLLNSYKNKQQLSVYTWPCSSYLTDGLFDIAPSFVLILILIFIDGCILFGFNLLFHAIIDEKHHGITELLRLISIQPILNSLSWFLRVFLIQFIVNIFLILILKSSFDGGIYLSYVSLWLIIPTLLLWTIQVFSRSIIIAHFFSSNLKASIWSWFIYIVSCWLVFSSYIRLPFIIHLMASAWLPFYSIKRLFILLFRINTNLGYTSYLINEILFIWFSMLIGSLLMWFLSYYLQQIRPGKYGIARSWSWPLDYFRNNRIRNQKRRESIAMQMIEPTPDRDITIRIDNLTKTYGGSNTERQLAVDHVSFNLKKSTIHGLIGHNGAGKTSTMEMICGLSSCDCGTIEIHDKDLYENLNELQTCIGYCPQQDMLFSHLTVQEQLEFYARVRSKQNTIDNNQIQQLLTMMEMNTCSHRLCHTLSGGMQRKLSILCAFVGQANVIVLDEPSSSLDPVARRILWSWLRENKKDRTLLVSSHLLDEVEELCDSVIILDSGKIRASGTILELKRQFGPPGDRLHLAQIPSYIPNEWIVDENNHLIQIPNRHELINLLERLERDNIKYSLENTTLDDIFIKSISSSEVPSEENNVKTQINTLFDARTSTQRNHLWSQQAFGVLIRRGQLFLRRARLLPILLLLYVAYALASRYMPSFTPSSTENIRYIISSRSNLIDKLPLKDLDVKFTPSFYSTEEFQQYLLGIHTWKSNYGRNKKIVGVRISSSNHFECYIPSPLLSNIITSCFPIFTLFSNQTFTPLHFTDMKRRNPSFEMSPLTIFSYEPMYYCLYTLPPALQLSIVSLLVILMIPTALIIQDYISGIHSYSLIHGLRSSIYWTIIFLSDLILCLLWLGILIIIARFLYASTFNGRFFALTPLFFIANLPFIYLISKFCTTPVLGATMIVVILLIAHFLYTLRFIIELFRSSQAITTIIHSIRWLLLLIFPNVNIYTLIVAVLRPYGCRSDDSVLKQDGALSYEQYSYKVLIHTSILIAQFIIYFILLIIIDTCRLPTSSRRVQGIINQQEEDNDVAEERHRIEKMTNEDKQREALVVNNLSKRYWGSHSLAVNRLTFAVPHRQCFGLLGFNGSGKTTTFRMLVGEIPTTSGYVYRSNNESIGYCPQDDIEFSGLTVLQSINYICRLHGVNPSLLNNLILSQFQLEKYRNRLVSHLSGGTRRRLHLALCLIGSPTLLLLDEPTAKVDPLLRNHIRLILQHRPPDTSIVFASHSMLECEQLCDRLTILVHGNARCLGSPRHLKEQYGTDYRIRLTPLHSSIDIPLLQRVDNSNEYIYPKSSLSNLFKLLESLVQQNLIASNYTIQLTSLEHIFLALQHPTDTKV